MPSGSGPGRADVARCWAGFASLGAGLVHLAVTREHFDEWWAYGSFFLVLGVAQIGWAVAALAARNGVPLRGPVIAANLAVPLLWAVTRTTGLPVGPEPWTPEAVGRADVLSTLLELAVAGMLLAVPRLAATDRQPVPAGRARTGRFVALMFAGAVAVAAVTTPALADTPAGGSTHGQMK